MRIISGDLKGRKFTGKIPDFVRPTTDNVREAIFNTLNNYVDFQDITVGDFCAGTGFYGFEAISRGAKKIYFFEKEYKACKFIENIAETFSIQKEKFEIIKGDIKKSLKTFKEFLPDFQFDLIFFDPPYKATFFDDVIYLVSDLKLLNENGIFIVESSSFTNLKTKDFKIIVHKDYGGTRVFFLELKQ